MVSEICFAVRAGEVLGLVGESGSGKTTVGLAMLGHTRRGLSITAGRVRLDGVDLLTLPPNELRAARGAKVSYVPQDPAAALNPVLRVGTQLKESLRVHAGTVSSPAGRIAEVMTEACLDDAPELLHRYPHQLSGGQQQRVALAMAFACRPSLIVLDEPTTGLDVSTQRHVLDTVRSLCDSYGVAAIYVSHDLAVVSGLVTQVAVMYAGRIVELGPTTQLFSEPLHPYTRGLIAAIPSSVRAGLLTGIEGQQPRPADRGPGCSFAARCEYAAADCRSRRPWPVSIAGREVRCLRVDEVFGNAAALHRPLPASPANGSAGTRTQALSVRALSASYGGPGAVRSGI